MLEPVAPPEKKISEFRQTFANRRILIDFL